MDLPAEVYLFECQLEPLLQGRLPNFQALSKFPVVYRDLALVVKKELAAEVLYQAVKKEGQPLLKTLELFDVYEGNSLPPGSKSLAFALSLQAEDHTLTEEEITSLIDKIVTQLNRQHGATLRV